jgi:hypothetical protein
LRCFGGATRNSKVCDIGISGPPITPCMTRHITRNGSDVESPHRNENTPNPSAAIVNTRTAPNRAASQPVSGTMMASATA